MRVSRMFLALFVPTSALLMLSLPGSLSRASAQSAMVSAASIVKPQVYVSLQPVPRGKEFQVAIVAEIARGYHMNSHKPTDPYLIPTTLTPQLPTGFQLRRHDLSRWKARNVRVLAGQAARCLHRQRHAAAPPHGASRCHPGPRDDSVHASLPGLQRIHLPSSREGAGQRKARRRRRKRERPFAPSRNLHEVTAGQGK